MRETIHPYFSYRDVEAALDWLTRAFGFQAGTVQRDAGGAVQHAEMRCGDGVLMMGQADDLHRPPGPDARASCPGTYLVVADVDAVFAQAVAAGARVVFPPEDTGWGARRCRVLDPEGYEWSFGTYRPGSEG